MSIPVLLVTGFLGAGKTTMINRLLSADHGEKVAAIVNDFGAINIDADLLAGAADAVVGLENGCICCSLQGDLLRTLRLVLRQSPDRIVIEASGAADPRGIIETVMDEALWDAVRLDAVVCLVDAADVATSARGDDALWRAQVQFSDFVLLGKTQGVSAQDLARVQAGLAVLGKPVFDGDTPDLPLPALFGAAGARMRPTGVPVRADRFVTTEWQADEAISLTAFQDVLAVHGQGLLRAKGILQFVERPGQAYLLQLVAQRVDFAPVEDAVPGCRLVLIGESGIFRPDAMMPALRGLVQHEVPCQERPDGGINDDGSEFA